VEVELEEQKWQARHDFAPSTGRLYTAANGQTPLPANASFDIEGLPLLNR
jgi:hypothetical protein